MLQVTIKWTKNSGANVRRFYCRTEQDATKCVYESRKKFHLPKDAFISINYGTFVIGNHGYQKEWWFCRDDHIGGAIARADDLPTIFEKIGEYKEDNFHVTCQSHS